MKLHFYHCKVCGKIIAVLSDTGAPTICCGRVMEELVVNVSEGSGEKHLPVYRIGGNVVRVNVGSEAHPMLEQHRIEWIGLRTALGFQFRKLVPGDSPEALFFVNIGDSPEALYAYCNIHGLWSTEIKEKS